MLLSLADRREDGLPLRQTMLGYTVVERESI